jgi:hypothetical protein
MQYYPVRFFQLLQLIGQRQACKTLKLQLFVLVPVSVSRLQQERSAK